MKSSSTGAIALVAVAGLVAATAESAQSPMQPETRAPDRQLIIIGASYAAGWGTPALPGIAVVNRGVDGQETAAVLARFDNDVVAAKPDAVLIWGHINDVFRAPNGDMDAAALRAEHNLREMVAHARAAGIEPIVATEVTLSKPGGITEAIAEFLGKMRGKESYQARINRHVRKVNEFLRRYAAEQRLQVLDIERALGDRDGFRRPEFTVEDGSHISRAGYDQLTAYARSTLSSSPPVDSH
jgi:lysophospholipase L1-like esterase